MPHVEKKYESLFITEVLNVVNDLISTMVTYRDFKTLLTKNRAADTFALKAVEVNMRETQSL